MAELLVNLMFSYFLRSPPTFPRPSLLHCAHSPSPPSYRIFSCQMIPLTTSYLSGRERGLSTCWTWTIGRCLDNPWLLVFVGSAGSQRDSKAAQLLLQSPLHYLFLSIFLSFFCFLSLPRSHSYFLHVSLSDKGLELSCCSRLSMPHKTPLCLGYVDVHNISLWAPKLKWHPIRSV